MIWLRAFKAYLCTNSLLFLLSLSLAWFLLFFWICKLLIYYILLYVFFFIEYFLAIVRWSWYLFSIEHNFRLAGGGFLWDFIGAAYRAVAYSGGGGWQRGTPLIFLKEKKKRSKGGKEREKHRQSLAICCINSCTRK